MTAYCVRYRVFKTETTIAEGKAKTAMVDVVESSAEEREALLNGQGRPSRTTSPSTWTPPEAVIHFQSMSVNYRAHVDDEFCGGTLRVIETDNGNEEEYEQIALDVVWMARAADGSDELKLSVDDMIALRQHLTGTAPVAIVQKRGGAIWGELQFMNGVSELKEFRATLERHAYLSHLPDAYRDGQLLGVDAKDRMRRAGLPLDEGASAAELARPGRHGDSDKVFLAVMEQFSRVTQVSREVADGVAATLTGRRAREQRARRETARANRLRASDLSTPVVPSTNDEQALPPRMTLRRARGEAVTRAVWDAHLDDAGRLRDPTMMRHAVFCGGIEKELRNTLWPVLLGVLDWDMTATEREQTLVRKRTEFVLLRENWVRVRDEAHAARDSQGGDTGGADTPQMTPVLRDYLQSEEQIAKDVTRTDRTVSAFEEDGSAASLRLGKLLNIYADYDRKIRYCQGMSDFMSQVVYHVEDEAVGFWCFEALMRRVECNFRIDQSGMSAQLARLRRVVRTMSGELTSFFDATDPDFYTCFRWIIVRFKRELAYEDTARMWEVLWTRHICGDSLHIYVAAALLRAHSHRLLRLRAGEFDALLRYINDMSGRLDVDFALREAEMLYRKLGAVA